MYKNGRWGFKVRGDDGAMHEALTVTGLIMPQILSNEISHDQSNFKMKHLTGVNPNPSQVKPVDGLNVDVMSTIADACSATAPGGIGLLKL